MGGGGGGGEPERWEKRQTAQIKIKRNPDYTEEGNTNVPIRGVLHTGVRLRAGIFRSSRWAGERERGVGGRGWGVVPVGESRPGESSP